jgi:hypothetical protein
MQKFSGFQIRIGRNLQRKCPILAKSGVFAGLEAHFSGKVVDVCTAVAHVVAQRCVECLHPDSETFTYLCRVI